MPYPKFDRDKLHIENLEKRKNKVYIEKDHILPTHRPENLSERGHLLVAKTAGRIRGSFGTVKYLLLSGGKPQDDGTLST